MQFSYNELVTCLTQQQYKLCSLRSRIFFAGVCVTVIKQEINTPQQANLTRSQEYITIFLSSIQKPVLSSRVTRENTVKKMEPLPVQRKEMLQVISLSSL